MSHEARNDVASKIVPVEQLSKNARALKEQGKKVVHCHGVFDLLHPGHIRHLQTAKHEGDVLVVTVTADRYVNKGPGRPVFNQRLRAESLAALECVEYVAINEAPTAVDVIRLLRPDVYAKGSEYSRPERDVTGKILEEEQAVLSVGGRIFFTEDITFSSSHLINTHFNLFPPETEEWLKEFRRHYSAEEVMRYLDEAAAMKVLVVGEAIIDEYVFCEALGKSTKDVILASLYRSTEMYAGGSLAVANHLAGFCREVALVTLLGDSDRCEDFVLNSLRPNVRLSIITWRGAPTIRKRRFVDSHTAARMFELYVMRDEPLDADAEASLVQALTAVIGEYDIVVVPDYGHGMLTPSAISTLVGSARFLAVNTQANAGNRGFNTIRKYPRADYVCLAGHEIALETRMRHASWRNLALEVSKRIDCSRLTVTLGRIGSLHYTPDSGFTEVPALAARVVDRVGAGDAFLAVTSPLVAQGAPWAIVGFVGNVAGAEMVSELGNRVAVSKPMIARHVTSLMK